MIEDRRYRNSALGAFLRCRRAFDLKYVQGWNLPDREGSAAGKGTLLHHMYQVHNNGGDPFEVLADVEDEKLLRLCRTVFEGYIDWLAETGADIGRRTVAVEQDIEWTTPHGFTLFGKPDRVVFDELSEMYEVEDFKTVDAFKEGAITKHTFQLLNYAMMLNASGMPVQQVRVREIKRSLRTAKATPPFYRDLVAPITNEMLDAHYLDLVAIVEEIERGGRPVPTRADHCGWCDYLPACNTMTNGGNVEFVLRFSYQKEAPQGE